MDSPAVKAYRDKFHLNLNLGRRMDVDATVTDLRLWQQVLDHWGYWKAGKWVNHSPLSISKMLSEYERLERKTESGSVLAYVERLE